MIAYVCAVFSRLQILSSKFHTILGSLLLSKSDLSNKQVLGLGHPVVKKRTKMKQWNQLNAEIWKPFFFLTF